MFHIISSTCTVTVLSSFFRSLICRPLDAIAAVAECLNVLAEVSASCVYKPINVTANRLLRTLVYYNDITVEIAWRPVTAMRPLYMMLRDRMSIVSVHIVDGDFRI
jgi:hypothetical protein